jgi:hypothetical protein
MAASFVVCSFEFSLVLVLGVEPLLVFQDSSDLLELEKSGRYEFEPRSPVKNSRATVITSATPAKDGFLFM